MDVIEIYDMLTDEEKNAISQKYSGPDFQAYFENEKHLMESLPAALKIAAADAFSMTLFAGELNGFCAGFYYALRMGQSLKDETAKYWASAETEAAQ